MIQLLQKHRQATFITALLSCLFFANNFTANAQSNVESFGQNRVQYRKFKWKFFDTQHFRIYHYDRNGVTLARYVAEQAERDISVIEQRMNGTFPKRFNVVLYNSYEEYRQTNLGLKFDNQIEGNTTGKVDIVGDKLLVYFTGVHTELRRQIRAGMSQIVLQRALNGDKFRDVVKNSLLLNLPPWVSQGYISYLVDGWDPLAESAWKNLLKANSKANFYTLADQQPELAGKAYWKYISDQYGTDVPKSLLYAMQMKSSINQGTKLALGMKVMKSYDSCLAWYHDQFLLDSVRQETPNGDSAALTIKIPRDNSVVKTIRVSPLGKDVAYCVFKEGEYFIYLQHTEHEQVRSLIMQEGAKDYNENTPDPNYPLLAWNVNGDKLAIMYQHGTTTKLRIYNSHKARIENYIIPKNRFDRVLGMTFNEDNDALLFSAVKKGQTDLYSFTFKGSKMTNITNDVWDDIDPQFIAGGRRRGILFLSNRPAPNLNVNAAVNQLPTGPMNLYFYDTKTKSPILLQCSYNKNGHLSQPIMYGPDNFAFLLDTNGVQNKYVVTFVRNGNNYDSAVPVPVTNYSRSILNHQYTPAGNLVADVLQIGKTYKVFYSPLVIPEKKLQPKTLEPTELRRHSLNEKQSERTGTSSNGPILKSGNKFQSEFAEGDTTFKISNLKSDNKRRNKNEVDPELLINPLIKDSTYLKLRSQNYRLSFKPDFFQARVDNSVLLTQYQSAELNGNSYSNPPLGGLLSLSLNDVLENQKFTGGVRLPINFSGMTYFLQYQNFTRRIDWGILLLRTANYYTFNVGYADSSGHLAFTNQELGKVTSSMIQGSASYPFDRRSRVDGSIGFRQDLLNFKAQDTLSLSFAPKRSSYWIMNRLEYVFDNSKSPVTNIREGARYKVYTEYLYGLSAGNKGGFYNFGADLRYYQKLYKHSILAMRLSTAHSEGNKHILYFLGGTDGWLNPQAGTTPPVTDQHYAFQALVTPLRGYTQNARNGNSYAVANFELRVPIYSTFFKRPVNSTFLRNLQIIGFTDMGSAWNGLIPNAENTTRTYLLGAPYTPVTLNISKTNDEGFAMGYGAGIRSTILGYFMRLDAAWNIEGQTKPIIYYSIGLDF